MSRKLIYVVEDEEYIQELIKYNLEAEGYKVNVFSSGESFQNEIKNTIPDLILLDIMLPGIDGYEVCRYIRQMSSAKSLPIIMLTAKGDEFDKVLGLELGADDYITKPFSVRELLSRIKALFRRINSDSSEESEVIKHDKIVVNTIRREVYNDDRLVEMPLKEFELLTMLMKNKGKVLSRDILLEKIWGYDYYGDTRTVDVHIRYLRQKIESDPGMPRYIETVRGIGYRFSDKLR